MLHATSLYAAVLAVLLLHLSMNVIKARRTGKVSVGDGGDEHLLRTMRTQANFTEYTPIALILIGALELNGFSIWAVHGLGIMFVVGRILHAIGLGTDGGVMKCRVYGMYFTAAVLALGAALNLWVFMKVYV